MTTHLTDTELKLEQLQLMYKIELLTKPKVEHLGITLKYGQMHSELVRRR